MSYTDKPIDESVFLTRAWYAPDGRRWNNDTPVPATAGYKLSELPSTAKVGKKTADSVWKLRGETDPATRAGVRLAATSGAPGGPSDAEVRKMISDAVEAAEQDKDEEIEELQKELEALKAEKAKADAAVKK
jgi:hypothetical protein